MASLFLQRSIHHPWLLALTSLALLTGISPAFSQTIQGKVALDVAMELDDGVPDPAMSGEPVSWHARVRNLDAEPLEDIGVISVNISATSSPPGFSFIAAGSNWACSINSCTYNGIVGAGQTTDDLVITGNAPVVVVPGGIDLQTSAGVGFIYFDPNSQNNTAVDSVTVVPAQLGLPDYAFESFTAMPSPVDPNGQITYTLVVQNVDIGGKRPEGLIGIPPSVSMSLTSTPSGASVVGTPSGTNWSCVGTDCSFASQLDPGMSAPPLTVVVMAPASGPGNVTLDALISGDKNGSNNSGTVSVPVSAPPPTDFAFQSISGSPDPVAPGATGQFQLVVEDRQVPRAPDGLPMATVNFSLESSPGGVITGVASGSNWSCSTNSCTYNGNLTPSQPSTPLTIPFTAPPSGPGSINLQAQLSGDGNTSNNFGQAEVQVSGLEASDLVFASFSANPTSVLAGGEIEFLVSIKELSSRAANGKTGAIGFHYLLSASAGTAQLLAAPSGSQWSCDTVSCSFDGSLAGGVPSPEVRFVVEAPDQAPATVTLAGEIFGDDEPSNNVGSATVNVERDPGPQPAQLALDKQGPAEAVAGEAIDYLLLVSNSGASSATQLRLFDNLPAGATLLSVTPGPGWNCQSSSMVVDCNLSTLGPGQSTQVQLSVRLDEAGEYLNRATLDAFGQSGSLSDSVLTTVPEDIDPRVDLRLVKRDSVDPVAAGGTLVYTLEVTNLSNRPATEVSVVDELPPGVTLLSAGGPGWSCTGTVSCKLIEALVGGASSSLSIEVQVPAEPGTLLNTASVSSHELDLNPADNVDSEQTTISSGGGLPLADLAVVAGTAVSTMPGADFTLTANLSNLGPDAAQGVLLIARLSGGAILQTATLDGQPCGLFADFINCRTGGIAVQQSLPLSVQLRAGSEPGSGALSLEVRADTSDPEASNNQASVSFTISAPVEGADIEVSGIATPNPVPSGGTLEYQLSLRNLGPAASSNPEIFLTLSSGQVVTAASGSGGLSCVSAATLARCTLAGDLEAGGSRQMSVTARVDADPGSTLQAQVGKISTLDPNTSNDSANISVQVGNRTEDGVRDQLGDAAAGDPTAGPAVPPVAEQCANPPAALVEFCNDLLQASDSEVRDVLAATAPEEALSQAVLAREISFAQFFNIDARLAELRGSAGGFSSAGLMLSGSGGALPLGQLLAGEESDDAGGLFGSPWGFFLNGTISNGEQNARMQRNQVGVDFESRGLTAGVDYRFSNALTAGVALGFANFDADISGDSSIDTQGLLLTGYASWYPSERFYIDGRISFGQIDFEQSRRVRFTLDGQTTDLLARGDADADQFSLAAGVGYHWNQGPWNITPNASVRYTDTSIDGFTENGAGAFNLSYEGTDSDSLLVAAGVQISHAISTSRGVLTPTMSLSFNHESNDEDLAVIARFASGGSQSFRFDAPDSDSSYGALGLGMVYVGPNGVQAYVNYRTVFGYDDFDRDTINLGARFEF